MSLPVHPEENPMTVRDSSQQACLLQRQRAWLALVGNLNELATLAAPWPVYGRLNRVTGLLVEATGLKLPLGSICQISQSTDPAAADAWDPDNLIDAEVVGFVDDRLMLMPSSRTAGLTPGAAVRAVRPGVTRPALGRASHPFRRQSDLGRHLPIGAGLLGRVLDSQGQPLDGFGTLGQVEKQPIRARRINAMTRRPIHQILHTGIRAIDGFMPLGQGQRIGLFAGAGVGKSVLLGMLAGYCDADVIVMAMVGERGREVREFVEHTLSPSARQRSTIVVSPADDPPLAKVQAAGYAASIAEHYRDQGLNVLFLMDSLTRYAMALREVALATGELPATRGYPPSVFARLPELIERSGNGRSGSGSITAVFTVLIEGDDPNDPVGDAARSFLDGHIVLTRKLADSGHFPAIDIEQSISRVATSITTPDHQGLARRLKAAWACYQRNRELLSIGAYSAGSDPEIDDAIRRFPALQKLLAQSMQERSTFEQTLQQMTALEQDHAPGAGA